MPIEYNSIIWNMSKSDTIINIEQDILLDTSIDKKYIRKYKSFCIDYILVFLFTFPFTLLDFSIHYNNYECLQNILNFPIDIVTSLLIYCYINIFTFSIYSIIFYIFGCYQKSKYNLHTISKVIQIAKLFCAIVESIWLSIGLLILIKYSYASSCSELLYKYVKISYILNLCFWLLFLFKSVFSTLIKNYKKNHNTL